MIPGLAWQLNAFQVLWRPLFLLLNHHLCFYYPQSLTVWLRETTCGHRPGNVEQTRKCLPIPLKVIALTKHQRQSVLNQILLSITVYEILDAVLARWLNIVFQNDFFWTFIIFSTNDSWRFCLV